jgi:hypothetical protein
MISGFQQRPSRARCCRVAGGFALVITLLLLLLLTLIAVGLLSLSAIEMRSSSQGTARAVAMANARLALVLALGDLQKKLGADRRATASAALATEDAPLGVTGVWESWDTKELGRSYNKAGKFRGWLTSAALASATGQLSPSPHVAPDSPGSVVLLGNGSLGDRATLKGDDLRIAMPKVRAPAGRQEGNLAWVTIDESAKARLDLHRDHAWPASIAQIVTAGAPGADGVFALDQLEKVRPVAATSGKMITYASSLLATGASALPAYSPDLTHCSMSLLTNPVSGGLKKDLSTLFARGLTASEGARPLYAGAGLPTGPTDPPLSLLAAYHDLYKRLGVAVGGTQPGPDGVVASMPAGFAAPTTPRAPTEPLLVPSLLRVDMIFSLVSHNTHAGNAAALADLGFPYRLYLMYLPVVTIHNPYNVPLVFDSIKISFADVPIAFQFRIGGQPLTNHPLPLNWLYAGQYGKANSKAFHIKLASTLGATSAPLRLEAGQTKLFGTPMVSPDWTWSNDFTNAKAGGVTLCDWWNGQTGEPTKPFEMIPRLVTQATTTAFGFTIDNIIPSQDQTPLARDEYTPLNAGSNVALRPDTDIGVLYEPYMLVGSRFTVTMELTSGGKVIPAGTLSVEFGSQQRLKEILEEGTSVRYPGSRTFPKIFPDPLVDGKITTPDIFEPNDRPVKDYVNAKPFAIFSLSGRTTMESFFRSRPYADGSPAVNAAKFDLSPGKDQPADLPFEMVMMPIRNNTSAIEEVRAKEEGYFFGGHGSLFGTPRATFYEFPRIPLQSLAGFRHANLAASGAPPFTTYTVGESRAHPMIPTTTTQATHAPSASQMLDHTWLSNTALWDSHFLSTLTAYSGGAFGSSGKSAATVRSEFFKVGTAALNPRLVSLVSGTDAERAIKRGGETGGWLDLASRLAIEGGFNVNSTSVDAWVAVLSSLRDVSLSTPGGAAPTGKFAAFPRVRRPSEAGIDGTEIPTRQLRWQGFRQLDETAIRELATRIVAEVRARGPFLTLSEFVNRRLGPATDARCLCGAVEAAIQKAKLNDLLAGDGIELNADNLGNHAYATRAAAYGPNTTAAPGSLTQGDVLSLLGSRLTTRGDTFVIRAYGDATNGAGQVLARAWCEAVVQRVPAHVDPADPPELAANQLNPVNQRFGRAFKVVAFRWLIPTEV